MRVYELHCDDQYQILDHQGETYLVKWSEAGEWEMQYIATLHIHEDDYPKLYDAGWMVVREKEFDFTVCGFFQTEEECYQYMLSKVPVEVPDFRAEEMMPEDYYAL